jgi:hypothetical protein
MKFVPVIQNNNNNNNNNNNAKERGIASHILNLDTTVT